MILLVMIISCYALLFLKCENKVGGDFDMLIISSRPG